MIDAGKRNVLGVLVDVVDYEAATERVLAAARERRPMAVTALAVHGVMTGVADPAHNARLNAFDLVTPDGQPVRWALNLLHRAGLRDRVYGPSLTVQVLERCAAEGLPVYLYGSTEATLERLTHALTTRFPALKVAGAEPSKFRATDMDEVAQIAERIRGSGARVVLVGLGCRGRRSSPTPFDPWQDARCWRWAPRSTTTPGSCGTTGRMQRYGLSGCGGWGWSPSGCGVATCCSIPPIWRG